MIPTTDSIKVSLRISEARHTQDLKPTRSGRGWLRSEAMKYFFMKYWHMPIKNFQNTGIPVIRPFNSEIPSFDQIPEYWILESPSLQEESG